MLVWDETNRLFPGGRVKTNYQNLSAFEMSAVVVAAIGLVLVGLQIFVTLPADKQMQVAAAFQILDVHNSVAGAYSGVAGTYALATDTMQNFYEQFDIAFVQTFSYPDTIGYQTQRIATAVANYSDSVAVSYRNTSNAENQNLGQVLGALIVNQQTEAPVSTVAQTPQSQAPNFIKPNFYKQYYYHAPQMVGKLLH